MDDIRISLIEERITEEEDNLDDTLSQDSLKNGDIEINDPCIDLTQDDISVDLVEDNDNDVIQELTNGQVNEKSSSVDSLEASSLPRSQHGGSDPSLSSEDNYTRKPSIEENYTSKPSIEENNTRKSSIEENLTRKPSTNESYTRKYIEDLSKCNKPPVNSAATKIPNVPKDIKTKLPSPKVTQKKFIPKLKPKESPAVKRRNTIDNSDLRGSQSSLISVVSCSSALAGSKGVLENKTSRARRQMIHTNLHKPKPPEVTDYVTPLQQKDKTIRELKQDLKSARNMVTDLENMLQNERERNADDVKDAVASRDKDIEQLREVVDELQTTVTTVTHAHEQALETSSGLEYQLQELKVQTEENERKHQEMYLKMYTKGIENAQNQRELELEELAVAKPDEVKVEELMDKLKTTQSKLQRWQDLKRQEAYDLVEVPTSDAGMTLRFLKDCMFHYLTNPKTSNDHLRAMIQIMGFTDVQMTKIKKAQSEKKKHKSK